MPLKPRKCVQILTKILLLISQVLNSFYLCRCCVKNMQGETFGTNEATDTFFAMTKLFQNSDVCSGARNTFLLDILFLLLLSQSTLRRMVYLNIKDMAKIANDVLIVTSRFVLSSQLGSQTFTMTSCVYVV